MKIKFSYVISFLMICLLTACSNQSSADWANGFVIWKGDLYVIDDEELSDSDLETKVGKVNVFLHTEKTVNYTKLVYSNHFPKNAIIYKIVNVDESEALAVKDGNRITKIINSGKYGK